MADQSQIVAALAENGQPDTCFDALCRLAETTVGARLFTITICDDAVGGVRRAYSNMPEPYPVSGTKPYNETDWSRVVMDERRTFVANDIDAIAQVFYDHELIRSLGCASVINVPVTINDKVIGTINCLHEAGYYTPERVAASETLILPGAACLLLARSLN